MFATIVQEERVKKRYQNDPVFHNLVVCLRSLLLEHNMDVSDISDAVSLARDQARLELFDGRRNKKGG